ncbi:MAG: hypothetical protein LUQ67_08090 [Methanomicrobiales archaeon]|nr:hypothetical protein [Methanomicrobiales archaeon]
MIQREDMVRPQLLTTVLAVFLILLSLAPGCTGQGGSQPPASTLTIPPTRVTAPPLTTPPPSPAGTTMPTTIPEVTPVWTPGTVLQENSAFLIMGNVLGFRSQNGAYIDEIRFSVVKAPRAEPVTFEDQSTQIVFTKGGTRYSNIYRIIDGDRNGNGLLEEGEAFLISVPLPPQVPERDIYPNQQFTMAIQNPPNAPVIVTATAPRSLTDAPMILATAR